MDEIRIQHVFRDEATGFTDAIVLPYDDYVSEYGEPGKTDEAKVDAVKAQRVANWQAAVAAPQPEPDLKAEAQALADEKAALQERLAVLTVELDAKIEALPIKDRPVVDVLSVEPILQDR